MFSRTYQRTAPSGCWRRRKKAFDSVPHSTILNRLQAIGVGGNLYRFVKAFIVDRTFSVMVGDIQGEWKSNQTGVPQAAVISPALFNIVISGVPSMLTSIPGLNFAVYADDITLWTDSGSPVEQELVLQTGLNVVHDYIQKCGMKTSPEKTVYVAVMNGPRLRSEAERNLISLRIGDSVISRKRTIRILGMLIDEDGGAKSWLHSTVNTRHQALILVHRVFAREWGIKGGALTDRPSPHNVKNSIHIFVHAT